MRIILHRVSTTFINVSRNIDFMSERYDEQGTEEQAQPGKTKRDQIIRVTQLANHDAPAASNMFTLSPSSLYTGK